LEDEIVKSGLSGAYRNRNQLALENPLIHSILVL
jgi:hypothetical protein